MNVKQQVIDARNNGCSYSQITNEFGIPKSTAQGWVNKQFENPVGFINPNINRVKPSKPLRTEENIQDFLSQLAPVKVQSNQNKPAIFDSSDDYALVISDLHFPMHCQKTINIFLETVLQLKPKAVILNGDTVDMLAISKYPKDIRHNYSLLEERIAYHKFLDDLLSVTATDTDIYEVSANHSGNGVEGRWFRYLSERLGELGCIPEIRDTLSYQNVFLGEYQKYVQYVDYVDLNGLTVIHGDVVRSAGGASALGMMQKWKTSLLMGHTHRLGMTCQRIPSIGNRPEAQLYAYEGGCACDLSPVYSSAPNWNQGFSIVGLGGETFSVEQVMVNAGIANIATLGQTLVG